MSGFSAAQAAAALALTLVSASPALAGVGADETGKAVNLNLHGTIAQHCAMGSAGGVDFGDITRPNLSVTSRVRLNCNMPFAIRFESANGGLANSQTPQGQGSYSGRLDYTLGVSIPLREPGSTMLERSFSGRDLLGGRVVSSGDGIALDDMQLTVALGRPTGSAGLLAGNYGETITITISPV